MNIPSRAPQDYRCPICRPLNGDTGEGTMIRPGDIVYRDEHVTAVINSFSMGQNKGNVIVVPNHHYENIYVLPEALGGHIMSIARKIAVAMKAAYSCDGVTLRQNNEPAGDQHAFHFHLHVTPRYNDDGYNSVQPADKQFAEPEERAAYAAKLKAAL